MKLKSVLLLVAGALIAVFLIQNSEQTAIKFLWMSLGLPRWALLGGLLVSGFMGGWIFGALRCRKKEQAKVQATEKVQAGEKEGSQEKTPGQ